MNEKNERTVEDPSSILSPIHMRFFARVSCLSMLLLLLWSLDDADAMSCFRRMTICSPPMALHSYHTTIVLLFFITIIIIQLNYIIHSV